MKKLLGWMLSLGMVVGLLGSMTGCPDKPKTTTADKKTEEKKTEEKKAGEEKKTEEKKTEEKKGS